MAYRKSSRRRLDGIAANLLIHSNGGPPRALPTHLDSLSAKLLKNVSGVSEGGFTGSMLA